MTARLWMQHLGCWMFRLERAEFYRDLADMYRRNEALMAFLEGEIVSADRTRQRARAMALRRMLTRYQAGDHAGRIGHLLVGTAPQGDALMLSGVDRADDKAGALLSLAEAVEQQGRMRSAVLTHAAFPMVLVPLCYALIRILSDVILAIDKGTPAYVQAALWVGTHGWARTVARTTEQYGLALVAGLVLLLLAVVWSLPRWCGPARLTVDSWPIYSLYRDFQSGLLFSSLAMLLLNGSTLKGALEDTARQSSPWMRWHILRVLRALDDNPTGTLEAFSRGILSRRHLARAATLQRTAPTFADVLVQLGTREGERVLQAVQRTARVANGAVVGALMAVCTFMGVATLSVPGRFSTLMEPSTLMGLRMAHEAARPASGPSPPVP